MTYLGITSGLKSPFLVICIVRIIPLTGGGFVNRLSGLLVLRYQALLSSWYRTIFCRLRFCV